MALFCAQPIFSTNAIAVLSECWEYRNWCSFQKKNLASHYSEGYYKNDQIWIWIEQYQICIYIAWMGLVIGRVFASHSRACMSKTKSFIST